MGATPVQIAEVSVLPALISYVEANGANPLNVAGNTTILIGQLQNAGLTVLDNELSALTGNIVNSLQAKLDAAKAAVAAANTPAIPPAP
jgi:hypothetical protein